MENLFEADVNYWPVVLAAAAAQVLGFLWYGPLFGRPWMSIRGYTQADVEGGAGVAVYVVPVITALLLAYVLARLVDMVGAENVGESIAVAAFAWLGFAATVQAVQINFTPKQGRKPALFAIEGGYQLATFLIAGAIIGAWQ